MPADTYDRLVWLKHFQRRRCKRMENILALDCRRSRSRRRDLYNDMYVF